MRLHRVAEPEDPPGPPRHDEIAQQRRDDDREAVEELTGAPVAVARVDDHRLGDVAVRTYVPRDVRRPTGTLVYLHGGGWVFGSLTTIDGVCRRLADRSSLRVVSVAYRLAPEHPWPAAVDDGDAVLATLAARDPAAPARTVVAGDSAGAYVATVVARYARDAGRALAGQALIYPAISPSALDGADAAAGVAEGLSVATMRWFWEQFLGAAPADAADPGDRDPLRADLAGLPPSLVLTAEHDILCAEGEAYADALAAAGVDVTAQRLLGKPHGFLRRLAVAAHAGRLVDHVAVWARDVLDRDTPPPSGPGGPARPVAASAGRGDDDADEHERDAEDLHARG